MNLKLQPKVESRVEDFYALRVGAMWRYFKAQHYSFWMICCYLFFEFSRPQLIFPIIDFLPWTMLFLLGSMLGAILDPGVKWASSLANKLIITFALSILVSTAAAHYPQISRDHLFDFFGWFVIYFLIINIINTRERLYIFLMIYLATAGKIAFGTTKIFAMRGFGFTGWGLQGPPGFFCNSGELAILMLMLFPLAFFLYRAIKQQNRPFENWILIALWVCPLVTIVGASSRGAQVAAVVQLAIIFRKSFFRFKPLIGVLLLCTSLFYLLPPEQKQRFSNSGDDQTSQQRLLYWEHGWEMMKDFPLTGAGYFNFAKYYEQHFPEDMLYEYAQLPHNIFIQVGTDVGFVGLSFFILIILYCLFSSWQICRRKNVDAVDKAIVAGLGYGVLGFLIAGQFVTVSYYPFLWIHLAFVVSFMNIQRINQEKRDAKS